MRLGCLANLQRILVKTSIKNIESLLYKTNISVLTLTIPSYAHIPYLRIIRLHSVSTRNFNKFEGSENTVESLQNALKCSIEEAVSLHTKNHNFLSNVESIKPGVNILMEYGIELNTIKENIWLLNLNRGQLDSKLRLLNTWQFTNINNGISLLKLNFGQLLKYTNRVKEDMSELDGKNRIAYFALFVKCDEKQVCDLFVKYSFMLSIKLKTIKEILLMTRDQGISKEDLLSDLWLFRYSPQFIHNRIKLLECLGAREKCKIIKPWMLRCTKRVLNRYLELRDENIAALGSYSNLRELLSSELSLSSNDVQEMILKHPPVAKISYSKAKDMIHFLKAQGFDSKMIYQVPRVLCHKQATLMARMVELKKISPFFINLQNLCRNKKDYIAFLNKIN